MKCGKTRPRSLGNYSREARPFLDHLDNTRNRIERYGQSLVVVAGGKKPTYEWKGRNDGEEMMESVRLMILTKISIAIPQPQ